MFYKLSAVRENFSGAEKAVIYQKSPDFQYLTAIFQLVHYNSIFFQLFNTKPVIILKKSPKSICERYCSDSAVRKYSVMSCGFFCKMYDFFEPISGNEFEKIGILCYSIRLLIATVTYSVEGIFYKLRLI